MTIVRKLAVLVAVAACTALPDSAAHAAGSGSMDMPRMPAETRTPEDEAKMAYNTGVKQIEKAQRYETDAAGATDDSKRQRLQAKSQSAYERAAREFEKAVDKVPGLYQAWNYLGFARRHLCRHDAALEAYDRALTLEPGYPEAIEYRGEAYLGLNRLDDARQAYIDLFARSQACKPVARIDAEICRSAASGAGRALAAGAGGIRAVGR
jgi:tetratricopeptide (TPR) repeat protein